LIERFASWALASLLKNRFSVGEVIGGAAHRREHEPIVDPALFEIVLPV
jgi:hypothetical protein